MVNTVKVIVTISISIAIARLNQISDHGHHDAFGFARHDTWHVIIYIVIHISYVYIYTSYSDTATMCYYGTATMYYSDTITMCYYDTITICISLI